MAAKAPTPAPWKRRGKYSVIDSTGKCVTRLRSNQQYRSPAEDEANAIIISYAPEMLELLNTIRSAVLFSGDDEPFCEYQMDNQIDELLSRIQEEL